MSKGTARVLQWGVAVALVALFLVLGDTSQLGRLSDVSWPWLVLLLLATAGLVLSASVRWRTIAVETMGAGDVPLSRFIHYFLMGRVLGFVLPAEAADMGIRTVALRRSREMSLAGAAYTVLLDRLFDLVVLVCLVVPALFYLGGRLDERVALGIGFAVIAVLPAVVGRRYGGAIRFLERLYRGLIRGFRFLPWLRKAEVPELETGPERRGLGGKSAVSSYLLSVVKLVMVSLRLYFVAGALGVEVPLWMAFICVPLAQVAALVAVTPGGLGILEAGWYGILVWAGVAPEETVLLVVGWRLYTFASLLCLVLGMRIREAAVGPRD
ncbi:MAG: flippase-like domain-containing protein [Candidatus Eisenbacteria sp.]|nr:flippase-like domain-containing protein [Candidatus Eisenbacteria bacterium]